MSRGRAPGRRAWMAVLLVVLTGCEVRLAPPRDTPADTAAAEAPGRDIIRPEGVASLPVFSPAVRAGGLIFLSGAIGVREGTLELVEGGIGPETRQTLENIRTVLDAAGAGFDDVVKCTVFLADIADYAAMNAVYAEYFPAGPPARSAMAGSGLALGARVEIECIARDPGA